MAFYGDYTLRRMIEELRENGVGRSPTENVGRCDLGGNGLRGIDRGVWFDKLHNKLYYGGRSEYNASSEGLVEVDVTNVYNPVVVRSSNIGLPSISYPSGGHVITGITGNENYLFVCVRSSVGGLPTGGVDNTDTWGALIIVSRETLEPVETKTFNAKCSDVHYYVDGTTRYLVLACQMSYVKFYTVASNLHTLTERDTQYFKAYKDSTVVTEYNASVDEQHRCDFAKFNGVLYCVGAGFGDGIHFWDMTAVKNGGKAVLRKNFSVFNIRGELGGGAHTFDVKVAGNYVYATLAPSTPLATSVDPNRVIGVLVLDVSDFSASTYPHKIAKVPDDMRNVFVDGEGDPRPCFLLVDGDNVFIDNGEFGFARFKINGDTLDFCECVKTSRTIDIKGMAGSGNGLLFVGDFPAQQTTGKPNFVAHKFIEVYTVK